jgi:hypothetical protein
MNCEQIEKISLLIDGELPSAEMRSIEQHLMTCAECQSARMDFLGLRTQISSYLPLTAPVATRPTLSRLLTRPALPPAQGIDRDLGRFNPLVSLRWAIPTLAVAAALLVAVAIGFRRSWDTPNPNELAAGQINAVDSATAPEPPKASEGSVALLPSSGDDKRKQTKSERSEASPSPRKPNSTKPTRPATPPKNPPPAQSVAPPNYAIVNGLEPGEPASATVSVRATDTESLTIRHLEQSELLLRSFRNIRFTAEQVRRSEVEHDRRLAQQLVYHNMVLRREAERNGEVQVATLLTSLEPILLDIANLPPSTSRADVKAIQQRVERKSLVALLQVNSAAVARAMND